MIIWGSQSFSFSATRPENVNPWMGDAGLAAVLPEAVVVPRAGGDSARLGLRRRRPLYYWEAAALKRLSQKQVEESVTEELAYAEATIPKALDDFEERLNHLREIERRLAALRTYQDLVKRIRSVVERMEETRISQLADQDEENEIREIIQFL